MYYNKQLVDLLSEILGFPKRYTHGLVELEFNCPSCRNNKFNLAVNTDKKKFQCWACEYRGTIDKIVKEFGTIPQRRLYETIVSNSRIQISKQNSKVEPISIGSFRSMKHEWKDSLDFYAAKRYLATRKIDPLLIAKWDICYAEDGPYSNRVIIPSKRLDGKVEYFVARDFYDTDRYKYKNPPLRKSEIIFGEKFIDWKKPVILTEGVFDAIVLPNSVPILGSKIEGNTKLIKTIVANRTPIIIGFDEDKTGLRGKKKVGKYLESLGITLYLLPENEYNDLAKAYQMKGKDYLISLIRGAKKYDEMDLAIKSLMMR